MALKVIRPETAASSARAAVLTQRLRQELQLARRVTHVNVLRVHDIGEAGGVRFVTMPYVEGKYLGAGTQRRSLSVERAIHLSRQIVQGFAAAHDVDVVHRDLKPQNILVDRKDHIYISDFGLAKCADYERDVTLYGDVHYSLATRLPSNSKARQRTIAAMCTRWDSSCTKCLQVPSHSLEGPRVSSYSAV